MLIKATEKFNKIRKFVIPGKITKNEFRELQKGKAVELLDDPAAYLIKNNFAVVVQKAKKEVKKDG